MICLLLISRVWHDLCLPEELWHSDLALPTALVAQAQMWHTSFQPLLAPGIKPRIVTALLVIINNGWEQKTRCSRAAQAVWFKGC